MSEIVLLFLFGVALLAADAFASSFVLAICGFGSMLAGCAVAYGKFGAVVAGISGVAAVALLGLTLYLELIVLPRTRRFHGLTVRSTSGQPAPPLAPSDVVGKSGEALTTLAPSGYVAVEGRRVEAFSQSGLIAKGEQVTVVGLDNFRLIVSKLP